MSADAAEHPVARRVVELAGRLVGEQQPGPGRDRDRERRELQVAGGQRRQRPVRLGRRARPGRAPPRGPGGPCPPGARRPGRTRTFSCGREVRQQVADGALEHQRRRRSRASRRAPAARPRTARGRRRRPCRRWAGTRPPSRLSSVDLPGAGGPEQADHLAGRDVQVDAGERGHLVPLGAVDVHQPVGADPGALHLPGHTVSRSRRTSERRASARPMRTGARARARRPRRPRRAATPPQAVPRSRVETSGAEANSGTIGSAR